MCNHNLTEVDTWVDTLLGERVVYYRKACTDCDLSFVNYDEV